MADAVEKVVQVVTDHPPVTAVDEQTDVGKVELLQQGDDRGAVVVDQMHVILQLVILTTLTRIAVRVTSSSFPLGIACRDVTIDMSVILHVTSAIVIGVSIPMMINRIFW